MSVVTIYKPADVTVVIVDGPPPGQIEPPSPPLEIAVNSVPIDTSRLVTFGYHFGAGKTGNPNEDPRYGRSPRALILTDKPFVFDFVVNNSAQSAAVPGGFAYPEYRMFLDGVQVATCHPVAGSDKASFLYTATGAARHAFAEIRPYDLSGNLVTAPVESYCPFWIVLDPDGQASKLPDFIIQAHSKVWFDRSQVSYNPIDSALPAPSVTSKVIHQWARVPKSAIVDLARPLTARPDAPFETTLTPAQINRRNLVPHRDGDTHRPVITNRSITVTENRQGYFVEDTCLPFPPFPLRDGPRGVATEFFPRVVRPGRNGKNYVMNPWALARYLVDGTKQTIAGWVCDFSPYWEDSQTSTAWRLVGDWSSIPTARRRGFLDCWGWDWDERTTAQGASGNVVVNGEVAHDGDVCSYATDRYGRLLELRRIGNDPGHLTGAEAPTVVREVLPPGAFVDPWGVKCLGGFAYVCDRGAHAIVKVQLPNTRTEMAMVVSAVAVAGATIGRFEDAGVALGVATYRRFVLNPGVTTAQALALECVAPECVDIKDGYLVWSSLFTTQPGSGGVAEVRRKPLTGGPVESLCRPQVTNKSHFCIFAISDKARGCFGPDWTIFTSTFAEQQFGRPQAFLPNTPANGVLQTQQWTYQGFTSYNVNRGLGPSATLVYSMSWGIAHGRLVGGSSEECLIEYSQAQPGDTVSNAAQMDRGGRRFVHDGGKLLMGDHGFPFLDVTMSALQAVPDVAAYLAESAKP